MQSPIGRLSAGLPQSSLAHAAHAVPGVCGSVGVKSNARNRKGQNVGECGPPLLLS